MQTLGQLSLSWYAFECRDKEMHRNVAAMLRPVSGRLLEGRKTLAEGVDSRNGQCRDRQFVIQILQFTLLSFRAAFFIVTEPRIR
jgi:hypothetical protein